MNKLKDCAKRRIKRSLVYQVKKGRDYFNNRKDALAKLKNDEICKKHTTIFFQGSKAKQLVRMMKKTKIAIVPGKRFQSWIDTGLYVSHIDSLTDNVAPNYEVILNCSVEDLLKIYSSDHDHYSTEIRILLKGIKEYIFNIINEINNSIASCENENSCKQLIKTEEYFQNMLNTKAKSLEEGFQRILFWSSLFWQSQHRLMGFGRLDKILSDLERPSDHDTLNIIRDFYEEAHRYFAFKSNGRLLGDTGQIIEIGGIREDGTYHCNHLTYLFIHVLKNSPIPDPKILLRVSNKMPDDLLELAVQCIATGVGCPLLSNDDVVIPALHKLGYSYYDACDYITSACWEPVAYGKSLEKNNIRCINYAKAVVDAYMDPCFENCADFNSVLSIYFEKLEIQLKLLLVELGKVKWEPDPLISLFTLDCAEQRRDISKGGAKYNNYGILSVGMANAVNSLLNIKHLVFARQLYSLKILKEACVSNFDMEHSDLQRDLQAQTYFGKDNDESVELTKKIADYTYNVCKNWRNPFGGVLKWGLSASNYVEIGEITGTTMDGRKAGEPLTSHISSNDAYTELVNFACKLDYSGQRSNGNVVDFFVAPDFMLNNMQQFIKFIKIGIREGFYQMQMNVVSSKTLIAAKENPELYPELIVRVWGFSAYFNDLPDEYKTVLISRAIESEKTA